MRIRWATEFGENFMKVGLKVGKIWRFKTFKLTAKEAAILEISVTWQSNQSWISAEMTYFYWLIWLSSFLYEVKKKQIYAFHSPKFI